MSFNDLMKRCCVFAVDFKPRIVGGVNVIPNFGKAGGAPTWLTLGNGTTATTFPTPLAGWGASFDGGDYVDTGVVDRYEQTDQFSLYMYGSANTRTHQFISSMYGILDYRGVALEGISIRAYLWLVNAFTSNNYNLHFINKPGPIPFTQSLAVSYNGTPNTSGAASFFINGSAISTGKTNESINGTIKSGRGFRLGGRRDTDASLGASMIGTSYAFGIFDGLLTPRDINFLDVLVKSNIK